MSGPEATTEPLRLGGMALRNGLLIHGPTSWSAAVRAKDGSIEVASGPKPMLGSGRVGQMPVLRGPLRLAEALAVLPLMRRALPSSRLPFEDRRVLIAAAGAAVAGQAVRRTGRTTVVRESAAALLGVLPALAALRDRDLAAYHGVEHKAIGGYEKGSLDPASAPKEHERCGSNLIAPMMVFSVAGQVIVERLLENPGPVPRAAAGIGGISGAVEVFAYADRQPASALGRAVHSLGHEIQRLVSTREPTAEQLEVGRVALDAILKAEGAGCR